MKLSVVCVIIFDSDDCIAFRVDSFIVEVRLELAVFLGKLVYIFSNFFDIFAVILYIGLYISDSSFLLIVAT